MLHLRLPADQRCSTAPQAGRQAGAPVDRLYPRQERGVSGFSHASFQLLHPHNHPHWVSRGQPRLESCGTKSPFALRVTSSVCRGGSLWCLGTMWCQGWVRVTDVCALQLFESFFEPIKSTSRLKYNPLIYNY